MRNGSILPTEVQNKTKSSIFYLRLKNLDFTIQDFINLTHRILNAVNKFNTNDLK
jgi:hypothetical protein